MLTSKLPCMFAMLLRCLATQVLPEVPKHASDPVHRLFDALYHDLHLQYSGKLHAVLDMTTVHPHAAHTPPGTAGQRAKAAFSPSRRLPRGQSSRCTVLGRTKA